MNTRRVDRSGLSIACAIGASVAFSINDISVKYLSDGYSLHQLVLIRSVIALAVSLAIFVPLEGGWTVLKTRRPVLHIVRGMCVVLANMSFFCGLVVVPLAEATAIFFIAPLLIMALCTIILGERTGPRRWAAAAVGLVGALLIVRPGTTDFSWPVLLPIAAAFCYAVLHTITRNMGLSENAATMAIYIQLTFIVTCAAMGLVAGDGRYSGSGHPVAEFLFRPWTLVEMKDLVIISLSGVTIAFGGYLISQAYRSSAAGLVAPFEYTTLILAVIWGAVIWGETPTLLSSCGMLLILVSGIFIAVHETALGLRFRARRISGRR